MDGIWLKPVAAAFELGVLRELLAKHAEKVKSELVCPGQATNSVDDVLQAVEACADEARGQWIDDEVIPTLMRRDQQRGL